MPKKVLVFRTREKLQLQNMLVPSSLLMSLRLDTEDPKNAAPKRRQHHNSSLDPALMQFRLDRVCKKMHEMHVAEKNAAILAVLVRLSRTENRKKLRKLRDRWWLLNSKPNGGV